MTIQLYMMPQSPPVRAVQMTAKALDIQLELKQIDLFKGEHNTPEYLKLNPQHIVPVINDNGTILWDSHAIIAYLVLRRSIKAHILICIRTKAEGVREDRRNECGMNKPDQS